MGGPSFRRRHPTLITPRDFDLSPYFHAIKFNIIDSQRLDYRNIIWAEDSIAGEAPAHTASAVRVSAARPRRFPGLLRTISPGSNRLSATPLLTGFRKRLTLRAC